MTTDQIDARVQRILITAIEARGEHVVPTFSIWNAFVPFIAEQDRIAAAERYADTISPGWRQYTQ